MLCSIFAGIFIYLYLFLCVIDCSYFSGSVDGSCIIWDIKRFYFLRSLDHNGPIRGIDIQRYSVCIFIFAFWLFFFFFFFFVVISVVLCSIDSDY
jgi:hypothetical protein